MCLAILAASGLGTEYASGGTVNLSVEIGVARSEVSFNQLFMLLGVFACQFQNK